MAYIRSIVDFLLVPSNIFFLLSALALIFILLNRIRLGRNLLASSVIGFFLFGYSSLAELLIIPLDTRFPPLNLDSAAPPDGIIVPGGMINDYAVEKRGALAEFSGDGAEAVPTVAILAKRYPEARIITSGVNEADGAKRLLMRFGIDPARIRSDPSAGTTRQNIHNILGLVGRNQEETWWLVASSHRMPRLMGTFRKAGFDPVPYPVDFRWLPPFRPDWFYGFRKGLALTDAATHEWIGLLFYRLTGRTDELFPGPRTST